jgi:predicted amidophosphoribosyltransferase
MVRSLTALYDGFLLTPRPGPGVCSTCFNLIDDYDQCFSCARHEAPLAGVLPVSYSVAHEQLHHALAGYKRTDGSRARMLGLELAAVLWRFLERHEVCLARAAGVEAFELVTTVPSSDPLRDQHHPLRWIVGELVAPTRERHERLLVTSGVEVAPREFSPARYLPTRPLASEPVLLIDDTWTTGASAQSAACALLAAGAGAVAAVVLGRHVNREWGQNDERLRALPRFDWERCSVCVSAVKVQRSGPGCLSNEATASRSK